MQIYQTETIKIVKDMQTINAGLVSAWRDEAGNERFYATSAITDEEKLFWSRGGAVLWAQLVAMLEA
jgi:hypothetical protein